MHLQPSCNSLIFVLSMLWDSDQRKRSVSAKIANVLNLNGRAKLAKIDR